MTTPTTKTLVRTTNRREFVTSRTIPSGHRQLLVQSLFGDDRQVPDLVEFIHKYFMLKKFGGWLNAVSPGKRTNRHANTGHVSTIKTNKDLTTTPNLHYE